MRHSCLVQSKGGLMNSNLPVTKTVDVSFGDVTYVVRFYRITPLGRFAVGFVFALEPLQSGSEWPIDWESFLFAVADAISSAERIGPLGVGFVFLETHHDDEDLSPGESASHDLSINITDQEAHMHRRDNTPADAHTVFSDLISEPEAAPTTE